MAVNVTSRLTAQSTLAELPAYGVTLDLSVKGEVLGEMLQSRPQLPGVVVTSEEQVRGVISRGQYLRLVGRHLGRAHPAPPSR